MCEERTTHIELNLELNAHQSSLKINLLLLSRTFFPVDIAYKTTNYHFFNRYGTFSRLFLLNITDRLTSLRLETIMGIMAPSIHAPRIAPIYNSDYNKTDGH